MNRLPLRQRMRWELAQRSPIAALAFAAVAAVAIFIPFQRSEISNGVRLLAGLSFFASLARYTLARRILEEGKVEFTTYACLLGSILVNSFAWAGIFTILSWNAFLHQEPAFVAYLTMMAFTAGSINSLSPARYLAQTFVVLVLGGQLLVVGLLDFWLKVPVEPGLLFCLPIAVLYFCREATLLRRRMLVRLRAQMRLEISNRLLVRSRQELVEQTSRNVHASRLASLGEMAGGVAHEINNPLAIIDLSLEAFQAHQKKLGLGEDSRTVDLLRRCHNAAARISTIVRGLRNFSRAGDQDPFVPFPVGLAIEDALDLCREKMAAHEVDFSKDGDVTALVVCRPVEIAQILLNLLNNSFDVVVAEPRGNRKIQLQVSAAAELVSLTFTDSGPPLSKAVQEKIFQPFFTTKPPGAGTGLGLSISRAIAKQHGGDLYLDMRRSQTTFVLTLPRAPAWPLA